MTSLIAVFTIKKKDFANLITLSKHFFKKQFGLRSQIFWNLYEKDACVSNWPHLCSFCKIKVFFFLLEFPWVPIVRHCKQTYIYFHIKQSLFKDIQRKKVLLHSTRHLGLSTRYYLITIVAFTLMSTQYIPVNMKKETSESESFVSYLDM